MAALQVQKIQVTMSIQPLPFRPLRPNYSDQTVIDSAISYILNAQTLTEDGDCISDDSVFT
jgi:hypothetical protein